MLCFTNLVLYFFQNIFYQFNEFSGIPEKLRKAVFGFIENPKKISTKSYQNIYHNLYKKDAENFEQIAKKYSQKAQVLKFLKSYGFTKPEIANNKINSLGPLNCDS